MAYVCFLICNSYPVNTKDDTQWSLQKRYIQNTESGVEVIIDDRNERPEKI